MADDIGERVRVGVDIGGTFTDLVAVTEQGAMTLAKVASTPDDPARGVLDGLELLARHLEGSLKGLLTRIDLFLHGTTVATNLLLERKGARLGLVTTEGFRDLLELREGSKPDRYNLRMAPPRPLVPRRRRYEVPERIRFDGTVMGELDEAVALGVLSSLRDDGVNGLVIGLLHSHRNGRHELRLRQLVDEMGWQPYVALSHQVLAREGEYDRLSTAAISAYVGPGLARYLERLAGRLRDAGGAFDVLVVQSTGGVLPVGEAVAFAVGSVLSGPAGGAMAGALFARLLELPLMVTCDMGGTSTDISLIEQGRPAIRQQVEISDMKICCPSIQMDTLGAGGGSIARLDAGGLLDVGPESAGASPGPACYGAGGDQPTVTDANLVLGYLSPEKFLGGRLALSSEAARAAVETTIAGPLGLGVEDAALAIHAIANSRVAEGVRAATVRRGHDPRDVSLLGFGGAAGLHVAAVATDLGINRVLVPRHASVLSALGFLVSDVAHHQVVSLGRPMAEVTATELSAGYAALEEAGRQRLHADGFDDDQIAIHRFADCRYPRQIQALEVAVAGDELKLDTIHWLAGRFEENYRRLYFHVHDGEDCVIDALRIVCLGRLPALELGRAEAGAPDAGVARTGTRRTWFDGWTETSVYDFNILRAGMELGGPALIESENTTVLVPPGAAAEVDGFGNMAILTGEMG